MNGKLTERGTKKAAYVMLVLLTALVSVALSAEAATQTAAGCSQADVQSAINAANDGDTVSVPAGNCTWTSSVQTNNKRITLEGAGPAKTVITVASCTSPGLSITNSAGKKITVFGIKFTGSAYDVGLIQISGTVKDFRITNCSFDWSTASCSSGWHDDAAIFVKGTANGIIDHNTFAPSNSQTYRSAVKIFGDSVSNAYARPSTLGTANSVYIEDNVFTQPAYVGWTHAVWAQQGGSYVFRHNTLTNWGIDMHGHCSWQGGREFEVYDNHWIATTDYGNKPFVIRGGTGVVYNNTYTSNGHRLEGEGLRMMEVDSGSTCSAGGTCHACSYPAPYQIGRGTNNTLDPLYMWNNKLDGKYWIVSDTKGWWPNTGDSSCCSVLPMQIAQAGRDYYSSENNPKPGYKAYTYPHPFTGSSKKPGSPMNLRVE